MNKKEVQQRVLQNGKPLDLYKFTWDENTKTFSSSENNLVIDFNNVDDCTFKTGSYCTFYTGSYCTFNTSSDCTFKTGSYCTFDTGSYCTFNTSSDCTFDTSSYCTFKTGSYCTFDTGEDCVVVRRDVYEVIELDGSKKIKLNECNVKGYTVIKDTKEPEELTMEQVCKELGREIKIKK
jgi:hypothetical protein